MGMSGAQDEGLHGRLPGLGRLAGGGARAARGALGAEGRAGAAFATRRGEGGRGAVPAQAHEAEEGVAARDRALQEIAVVGLDARPAARLAPAPDALKPALAEAQRIGRAGLALGAVRGGAAGTAVGRGGG